MKNTRTPHERRAHAMQVATGVTAVVALVWLTTLGLRVGSTPSGDNSLPAQAGQVAGAAAADSTINTLVVASSTTNLTAQAGY